MPSTSLVNLSSLIDDAKCYDLVRQQRWPDGVRCPALRQRDGDPPRARRHPAAAAALPLQGVRGPASTT